MNIEQHLLVLEKLFSDYHPDGSYVVSGCTNHIRIVQEFNNVNIEQHLLVQ